LAIAEAPDLWKRKRLADTDTMLFSAEDLTDPDNSPVFREILIMSDDIRSLSHTLIQYCKGSSIDDFEKLEDVVGQIRKMPWEGKTPVKFEKPTEVKVDVDNILRKVEAGNQARTVDVDSITSKFRKKEK